MNSAVTEKQLLSNRISWLAFKTPTNEINILNARRLSLRNKDDYLLLDSLITHYANLPDTTTVK